MEEEEKFKLEAWKTKFIAEYAASSPRKRRANEEKDNFRNEFWTTEQYWRVSSITRIKFTIAKLYTQKGFEEKSWNYRK